MVVEEKIENKMELYTVLSPKQTGIHFKNILKESTYMNGLFYEYFYNGGGVAIADFNGNGLKDIYFINSLKSNTLYMNQGEMKFKDVSYTSNAKGTYGLATGVTVVDINNDGLMDIYICKSGKIKDENKRRNELLVNQGNDVNGNPVFKEEGKKYGLDLPHFSTQASFFDYDKDGDLDMFLINHGVEMYDENSIEALLKKASKHRGEKLYENVNGKFIEVSKKAGLVNNMLGFGLGLTIGDINNDGWPDVYVGNDFSGKDHMYLNNQDGTFKEVSEQTFRHMSNFSMGNDMADINNDGLIDIITVDMMAEDNYTQKTSMSGMNPEKFYKHTALGLHHQYMYNALQLNNGVDPKTKLPKFSDIAQLAGVSSTDWSWSPLFFDMNNDGIKDLFISNGVKRDFRNNDFLIYHKLKQNEVKEKKSMDTEKYISNLLEKMPSRKKENYFFLNNKNLTFEKIKIKQETSNSNGTAYADLDNDGDMDLVVNNSDDYSFIYQNNTSKEKNYIKLKLTGEPLNPFAVGAKVELFAKSGYQMVENYFTRGFQSAMANDIHFGLGTATSIDSISITWPNGKVQKIEKVAVNKTLKVKYAAITSIASSKKENYIFKELTKKSKINFKHKENDYNDFEKESLIPHKMSQIGPALAVADVNGDGLDDFFIGGALGQSGQLYIQNEKEQFFKKKNASFIKDKNKEDTGALFFDADLDGDLDLYVVSGGTEKEPNANFYQDRLYENVGNGQFIKKENALPKLRTSGKKVIAGDFDKDGDLDLFVGSRVLPGHYGHFSKSFLLENKSTKSAIKFIDITEKQLPEMLAHTMVTDALWEDMDKDGNLDLIVANEWGPIEIFLNKQSNFVNATKQYGLDTQIGWWSSLAVADLDADGYLDIVAGNLGLNYKYKATVDKPFYMYLNDFDGNNTDDIVLGYHQNNEVFPVRGRQCTSNQMAFVKDKFKTYNKYGSANLKQVYGDKLNEGIKYAATTFATAIFRNKNNTSFQFEALENAVQVSSVNKIFIADFDKDGYKDLVLLGNLYGSEVETPRNDASYGHFMKGNGKGKFKAIPANISGLWAEGDIKDASELYLGKKEKKKKALVLAKNNDALQLIETK